MPHTAHDALVHPARALLSSASASAATAEALTQTLVEHGVLAAGELVEPGIAVADASRRNRNYVVAVGEELRAFCKLGGDAYGDRAIVRELHSYGRLAERGVARLAPEPLMVDDDLPLLVLPFVEGPTASETLQETKPAVAVSFHRLGSDLARLHAAFADAPAEPADLPLALNLARPRLEDVEELSGGAVAALEVLHDQAGLVGALEALTHRWSGSTLIHGDLRLENLIVGDRVLVVDWESLAPGPPEWDIGFLWASALKSWVFSFPEISDDRQFRERIAASKVSLDAVQLAMVGMWHGYAASRPADAQRLFPAALRCVTASLAQAALEAGQLVPTLPRAAVLLLQLAANAAKDPWRIAQALFGRQLRLLPGATAVAPAR